MAKYKADMQVVSISLSHVSLPNNLTQKITNELIELVSSYQISETDQAIALLLCEWAVSKHRVGRFRSLVVAKLLQKRQMELQDEVMQ